MSFVSAAQTKPVSEITRRTANFHPTIWGDYFLKYAYESQVCIYSTNSSNWWFSLQQTYIYIYIGGLLY